MPEPSSLDDAAGIGTDGPDEVVLHGGVANAGAVVRVGEHVLRPSSEHAPAIHAFLTAIRATGFEGASLPVGIDADGRERLEFIAGDVPLPPYPDWARSDLALASIAALMRRFHEASRAFDPGDRVWSGEMADPAGGPIVGHNDVCLENVVFRGGRAVALLDFDFAAPGRPAYDLSRFARMCVPIDDDDSASRLGWGDEDRPARLRLVADTYGLDADGRAEVLADLDEAMASDGEFVRRRVELGEAPFIVMWEAMGGAERYARRHRWWLSNRAVFATAMA